MTDLEIIAGNGLIASGGRPVEQANIDRGWKWGPYETRIRLWERVLGRRAPSPTRVTGTFVGWVQSLPDECLQPEFMDTSGMDWELWSRIHDSAPIDVVPPDADKLPPGALIERWQAVSGRRKLPAFVHLNPVFVEWMMGLDPGRVTAPVIWADVDGNHRNLQLRALGNGVAPQQAGAAIRWCLKVRERIGL